MANFMSEFCEPWRAT